MGMGLNFWWVGSTLSSLDHAYLSVFAMAIGSQSLQVQIVAHDRQ